MLSLVITFLMGKYFPPLNMATYCYGKATLSSVSLEKQKTKVFTMEPLNAFSKRETILSQLLGMGIYLYL